MVFGGDAIRRTTVYVHSSRHGDCELCERTKEDWSSEWKVVGEEVEAEENRTIGLGTAV